MKFDELKAHLKSGEVYRRADLEQWSKSIDRHIQALVESNVLHKLSQGLYYYPSKNSFWANTTRRRNFDTAIS